MNAQSAWVIEYSHSQQSFHVGRTTDMLRRNISSIRTGQHIDYICVGIFPSREQATEAILEFRRNRVPGYTMLMPI